VIRVLLADDSAVFLAAMREVVLATPGFEAVAEVASGEAAVAAAERTQPDLVLLDVRMPGIGGAEASRRIRDAVPTAVIVMVTADTGRDVAEQQPRHRASALIDKLSIRPGTLTALWQAHGPG
jgi:DNA-binding NarL/FixJ family response regulator